MNPDIARALAAPDVRERLVSVGVEPATNTPEQFAAFVREEIDRWAKVVSALGAKAE